jgi:hypothetical protein
MMVLSNVLSPMPDEASAVRELVNPWFKCHFDMPFAQTLRPHSPHIAVLYRIRSPM